MRFVRLLGILLCVAYADNMVLDFEMIRKIELYLKPNQTLMIDHKSGTLLGIMEILPSGKIRQIPLPQELIGKSEADILGWVQNNYDKKTEHLGTSTTTIYTPKENKQEKQESKIKGTPAKPNEKQKGIEDTTKPTTKKQSNIEWDKSKIIYENTEETLEVLH